MKSVNPFLKLYTVLFSICLSTLVARASTATVSSVTLVDAVSNRDIRQLNDGDKIDLSSIGATQLSVRANTNPSQVGSVKFVLSGPVSISRVENYIPYTLFGDSGSDSTSLDYLSGLWSPPVAGSYTLSCTPYSLSKASGTAGTPYTIHFSFYTNKPPYVNAGSDTSITLPTNTISLHGSASDSDGYIVSTVWTQKSGPSNSSILNATTLSPTMGQLVAGTYLYLLTVKDNAGAISSNDVQVIVKPALTTTSSLSAPTQTCRYKTSTGANFNYVEYLPEGYVQSDNWPVIIFLHGIGETNKPDANGKPTNLISVAKYGPIHYASPVSPGLNHKLPCVIIAPQCNKSWYPVSNLDTFRKWILNHYKIDPKRQYLTGLSLGGAGCNVYCASYGQSLAAVMPMSPGSALTLTGAQVLVNNHIPFWGCHAKDDNVVTVQRTITSMSNIGIALGGINNFTLPYFSSSTDKKTAHHVGTTETWSWVEGQGTTTGVPQYFSTIYATGGHAVWDRMYTNATTYTWLLSKHK